jgi:hypothetical protein
MRVGANPRKTLLGSSIMILTLPDKSHVELDKRTLQFHSAEPLGSVDPRSESSPELVTTIVVNRLDLDKVDFDKLAGYMQKPHLRFGDCFRRISNDPRYSPKRSVHDFDVRFLTRLYKFPGSYQGGTFSSSNTEWNFLDGGIISRNGYGWGSHSWTVVQGAEALRAVCMFFGIEQPLAIRGEPARRPLSVLLEEMTKRGARVRESPT